ncbi:MAG: hypothetical protein O2958_04875 [Gemmatimonadetes bacterium]|nr:hypothetical protein [Gemmatimonadota bacterium]MDA1102898.1 hypothetical protein [Gemmatimonadota bacterium]
MEELIFFAVIIFFSIIESISRSRKAKGGEFPEADVPEEWESAEGPARYTEPYGSSEESVRRDAPSKTMLSGDLLDELAALAGRLDNTTARTLKLPTQSPPLPAPSARRAPAQVSSWEQGEKQPRTTEHGAHKVHLSHAGYGTDPSERARSEQDNLDPLAVVMSQDAAIVRRQLRGHRSHALRQAVILQELLGPPAALRGSPGER